MPKGLTTPQQAALIRVHANGGYALVSCMTGTGLQRRGYGTYQPRTGYFYSNEFGKQYAIDGTQREVAK